MGISERRMREKEKRRQLIVAVAKRLILENGVAGVSMRNVAEAAELSKATLYLYFRDKEDLLAQILRDSGASFARAVSERLPDSKNGLDRLKAMWNAYLDMFGKSADVFVLAGIKAYIEPAFPFGDSAEDSPVRFLWQKMGELVTEAIRLGIEDGSLYPRLEAEKTAMTVMLMVSAIIDKIAWLPRCKRDGQLIRETFRDFFELVLQGLADPGVDRALYKLAI